MNRDEIKQFGVWLKKERQARKLTQAYVAKAARVTSATICAIEKGSVRAIGSDLAERLHKFFDTRELATQNIAPDIIEAISAIVAREDFEARVNAVRTATDCSRSEAVSVVLRLLLKNSNK